jgi:hypothetical protein
VERYNLVDLLKNEKSMRENSDIIINDLKADAGGEKARKLELRMQNKLKRQKKERRKRKLL